MCLTRPHALRAFVSSGFTCLTSLCALHAFVPHVPLLLTSLTHAPYLRALHALFVRVKIVLGWICSPAKSFHIPRTVKHYQLCCF